MMKWLERLQSFVSTMGPSSVSEWDEGETPGITAHTSRAIEPVYHYAKGVVAKDKTL